MFHTISAFINYGDDYPYAALRAPEIPMCRITGFNKPMRSCKNKRTLPKLVLKEKRKSQKLARRTGRK